MPELDVIAAILKKMRLLTLRITKVSNLHLPILNPLQVQDNSDCLQSIRKKEGGHKDVHRLVENLQTGIEMISLLNIMLRKKGSQTIELGLSWETYRNHHDHKQNGEQRK